MRFATLTTSYGFPNSSCDSYKAPELRNPAHCCEARQPSPDPGVGRCAGYWRGHESEVEFQSSPDPGVGRCLTLDEAQPTNK